MALMTGLTQADIQRMRDQLFFEGPERGHRLSRYGLLLPLSAVIASAGVVSDSTATVIGAMIVAPLMTPILGIVLAVVLTDGANLRRCLLLVITGATAVVAVGWLLGLLVPYPVVGHAAGRGHRHLAGAAAGRRRPHPGIRSSPTVAGRAHDVYHQRRGHPGQRHRGHGPPPSRPLRPPVIAAPPPSCPPAGGNRPLDHQLEPDRPDQHPANR